MARVKFIMYFTRARFGAVAKHSHHVKDAMILNMAHS